MAMVKKSKWTYSRRWYELVWYWRGNWICSTLTLKWGFSVFNCSIQSRELITDQKQSLYLKEFKSSSLLFNVPIKHRNFRATKIPKRVINKTPHCRCYEALLNIECMWARVCVCVREVHLCGRDFLIGINRKGVKKGARAMLHCR